jgi:hypothetical protein
MIDLKEIKPGDIIKHKLSSRTFFIVSIMFHHRELLSQEDVYVICSIELSWYNQTWNEKITTFYNDRWDKLT